MSDIRSTKSDGYEPTTSSGDLWRGGAAVATLTGMVGGLGRWREWLTARDEETVRRVVLTAGLASSLPQLLTWAVIYEAGQEAVASKMLLGWAIGTALLVALVLLKAISVATATTISFACVVLANLGVTVALGGLQRSHNQFLWGVLAPVGALLMFGIRRAILWFVIYAGLVVALAVLPAPPHGPSQLGERSAQFLSAMNIILPCAFLFLPLLYFLVQNQRFFRELQCEKERSRELLLNTLPEEIVDQLTPAGPTDPSRPVAKHYESATILFIDLVGFTKVSREQLPEETLMMLNRIFTEFDSIVERHALEKIKTIGDCYMVAGGLPTALPEHGLAVVRSAMEMAAVFRENNPYGLSFRAGIHSGPVAAGVIGRKKFLYDVWGDTVNTASRLESHGVPGRIQISAATYELVKGKLPCEARGTVDLKGKGEVETWLVGDV